MPCRDFYLRSALASLSKCWESSTFAHDRPRDDLSFSQSPSSIIKPMLFLIPCRCLNLHLAWVCLALGIVGYAHDHKGLWEWPVCDAFSHSIASLNPRCFQRILCVLLSEGSFVAPCASSQKSLKILFVQKQWVGGIKCTFPEGVLNYFRLLNLACTLCQKTRWKKRE